MKCPLLSSDVQNVTFRWKQSMCALNSINQSKPNIISKSIILNKMKSKLNLCPTISRSHPLHMSVKTATPLTGVLTSKGSYSLSNLKPSVLQKAYDMKECEAPVSIKTRALEV